MTEWDLDSGQQAAGSPLGLRSLRRSAGSPARPVPAPCRPRPRAAGQLRVASGRSCKGTEAGEKDAPQHCPPPAFRGPWRRRHRPRRLTSGAGKQEQSPASGRDTRGFEGPLRRSAHGLAYSSIPLLGLRNPFLARCPDCIARPVLSPSPGVAPPEGVHAQLCLGQVLASQGRPGSQKRPGKFSARTAEGSKSPPRSSRPGP